jgi:hypothetical protein
MPYRRLPNTDQARLRALRAAMRKAENQTYTNQVLAYKTIHALQSFLPSFESKLTGYQQNMENLLAESRRCQQFVNDARMYVSHFIQVLNLAVIRGEIKREHKRYYQLDPENNSVPDLQSENALLEWGKNIISGEVERTRSGGIPIYNTTIGKVQVHYDLFREFKQTQKMHQFAINRANNELVISREKGDAIILDVWNQVEEKFKELEMNEKLEECKKYGIVYYYRRGEKETNPGEEEKPEDEISEEEAAAIKAAAEAVEAHEKQENQKTSTPLQSTLFFQ